MEWEVLAELLKNRYDGIVDFLIYSTKENALRLPLLASQTGHYLYLSTYRVYDNKEVPIRESSPLLIDTADDRLLRLSDDYSIYKARGEAILKLQKNRNWTIIRPAGYRRPRLRGENRRPAGTGAQQAGDDELGRRCGANDRPAAFQRKGAGGNLHRRHL